MPKNNIPPNSKLQSLGKKNTHDKKNHDHTQTLIHRYNRKHKNGSCNSTKVSKTTYTHVQKQQQQQKKKNQQKQKDSKA